MVGVLLACAVVRAGAPERAVGEQASQPGWAAAGGLDAGANHTCALLVDGGVRCWGFGADGRLGYGNTDTVGDDETPGSVGPVDLGGGRTATAISAGDFHTCALLDDGSVRCWGFGANGRLGYANTNNVGDKATTTPDKAGPVDLGVGRTARAITAGGAHTCALLDDGSVRCWGFGGSGQLGYANIKNVGDDETPGSLGPVNLGRSAVAISAGGRHTCALLDDGSVRCWGYAGRGALGYANTNNVGDDETPASVGPVDLGPGRKATAISTGDDHTCARLDDGSVRCWGYGLDGRLGYGNQTTVGDNETPGSVGPVDLGAGRTVTAITAGARHTCARLDGGSVRCWGYGDARLGYASTNPVGDNEVPGSVGPVDLGVGRTAVAITAGESHTCARLDDRSVRCWGLGANGRLGYCSQENVGDDETPGSVGPVDLGEGGGVGCPGPPVSDTATSRPSGGTQPAVAARVASLDAVRAAGLRGCLAAVGGRLRAEQRSAARRRAGRRRCLARWGRTPGAVRGLRARGLDRTRVELDFFAPGSDKDRPPAAQRYLVKQSRRPIRSERDFARAQTLCHGSCRVVPSPEGQPPPESGGEGSGDEPMGGAHGSRCLAPHGLRWLPASDPSSSWGLTSAMASTAATQPTGGLRVGACVTLTITDLLPHTTYYYAIAARDNISAKRGPRSPAVKARTR